MAEPFIGEIIMFGGNFAPRGWAFCDGQLLPIASYTALFSLLGTTYGGDGRTTFALPDLRGRVPLHAGNGPGLTSRTQGEKAGIEEVTLSIAQIPSHDHALPASQDFGDAKEPNANVPAKADDGERNYSAAASTDTYLQPTASTGGSQSHTNMQPYLGVRFIIALEGIYPSRS